jgi:bifunctional non-homologous end joining protein LigD
MASIFDALHRRGTVTEAMLYAFDLLELDGEDLRGLPLADRKKRLARLLGGRRLGIVLSDRTDEDGATIFRQECRMGLEGIVSKRLTAPYRSAPSRDWLKVKAVGPGRSDSYGFTAIAVAGDALAKSTSICRIGIARGDWNF